ncbi:hypothetical protein PPERSA_07558 [Pseudocohnilembus persalinus]|uniref:Uncharacterized protein n=1 Tax=Pseudocohnilembus persalinus TaxID=266149 RepID=A0A0V0R0G6_PSEPJ|nr:hypothetical protein PPERSA_07558 [Pseudocohnilembus persalinus]|eukprot:KRX07808.1 hypothetical protein PPERSA_07558 [Pseudocohnilembus persalinus]
MSDYQKSLQIINQGYKTVQKQSGDLQFQNSLINDEFQQFKDNCSDLIIKAAELNPCQFSQFLSYVIDDYLTKSQENQLQNKQISKQYFKKAGDLFYKQICQNKYNLEGLLPFINEKQKIQLFEYAISSMYQNEQNLKITKKKIIYVVHTFKQSRLWKNLFRKEINLNIIQFMLQNSHAENQRDVFEQIVDGTLKVREQSYNQDQILNFNFEGFIQKL